MFCKRHHVRPPIQEPSSFFFLVFLWWFPISFMFLEGMMETSRWPWFCFPRGRQWPWLGSGLSILTECATWMLLAGREEAAVGWECAVLGRAHRAEGQSSGSGLPLWSCPPFGLSWVTEIGCHSHPLRGGGGSHTSDNWAAVVTLGTMFLLSLGMENGEDCFIKHCFEAFLGQGRAFQVALCSNLKHKERRERREGKAQWRLPPAQPGATAACLTQPGDAWDHVFSFCVSTCICFTFWSFYIFCFLILTLNDCGLLLINNKFIHKYKNIKHKN